MNYSKSEICEIQELISGLCGEQISTEQAIETYEEMLDSDDMSESHFFELPLG